MAASKEVTSPQGEAIEEFAVPEDLVFYARDYKPHIEGMFDVELTFGLVAEDSTQRNFQWIYLKGKKKDCREAKKYVTALVDPKQSVQVEYPEAAHDYLMDPVTHCNLERPYTAAIVFQAGNTMTIQGNDMMSVALAVSAAEDLISKFRNQDEAPKADGRRRSTKLLDQEFQRLQSEEQIELSGDDYSHMTDAVKRSLLNGMRQEDDESQGESNAIQGDFARSDSPFKDIHAKAGRKSPSVKGLTQQLERMDTDSTFPKLPDLGLVDRTWPKTPDRMEVEMQTDERAREPSSRLLAMDTTPSKQNPERQSERESMHEKMRAAAMRQGYSKEEIDEAFLSLKANGSISDLLRILVRNKTAKQSSALLMTPDTFKKKKSEVIDLTTPVASSNPHVIDLCDSPERETETKSKTNTDEQSNGVSTASNASDQLFKEYLELQDDDEMLPPEEKERRKQLRVSKLQDMLAAEKAAKQSQEKVPEPEPILLDESKDTETGGVTLTADKPEHVASRMDTLDDFSMPYQKVTRQNQKKHTYPEPSQLKDMVTKDKKRQKTSSPKQSPSRGKAGGSKRATGSPGPRGQKAGAGPPPAQPVIDLDQWEEPARQRSPSPRTRNTSRGRRGSPFRNHSRNRSQPRPFERDRMEQMGPPMPIVARKPPALGDRLLRHIVIDGSNMAMEHGLHKQFSCQGIKLVVEYFERRGHENITAIVPQHRTKKFPTRDQHILEELASRSRLIYTPNRKLPTGRHIASYDDRWMLNLAAEVNGVVVSNDQYRDLYGEKPDTDYIIVNRLLAGRFVGNLFMVADDPMGRDGPMIDEFLSMPREERVLPCRLEGGGHAAEQQPMHVYAKPRTRWEPPEPPAPIQQPPLAQHFPYYPTPLGQHMTPQTALAQQQIEQQRIQEQILQAQQQQQREQQQQRQQQRQQQQQQQQQQQKQKDTKQKAPRVKQLSQELFLRLQSIFPSQDADILAVLKKNPCESDINTLSNLVMEHKGQK